MRAAKTEDIAFIYFKVYCKEYVAVLQFRNR